MPNSREIKRRIKSVKNTQQITRAMKMVASAKMVRSQEKMVAMRPYSEKLSAMLRYLAVDLVGDEHPLFQKSQKNRVATIVIAGDRGLCGGFNTNILRTANEHFASMPDVEHMVFPIGKRAISKLRRNSDITIVKSYFDVFDSLSYILSGEICDLLVEMMMAKETQQIDSAYIIYSEFISMMSQKPVIRQILPIDYMALKEERTRELAEAGDVNRPIYEIEPDPETALSRLVSRTIATKVFHATIESYTAELAARMTAMDNATNNAEEMIELLTLQYNRARQAGITAELLDIVGGAAALG